MESRRNKDNSQPNEGTTQKRSKQAAKEMNARDSGNHITLTANRSLIKKLG